MGCCVPPVASHMKMVIVVLCRVDPARPVAAAGRENDVYLQATRRVAATHQPTLPLSFLALCDAVKSPQSPSPGCFLWKKCYQQSRTNTPPTYIRTTELFLSPFDLVVLIMVVARCALWTSP